MNTLQKRISALESARHQSGPQIVFLDSDDERAEAKALILAGRHVIALDDNDGVELWEGGILRFSTMGGRPMGWAA